MWQCPTCDVFNEEAVLKCENCETEKQKNINTIATYSLNSIEALKLIKNNISSILESSNNWKVDNIKTTHYPYFKIVNQDKNEEISVILTTSEVMPKDINCLKLEAKPALFILPNDRPSIESSIKREDLFFNIPLEFMLAYNQPNFEKEHLSKNIFEKLDFVSVRSNLLAHSAAIKSFERLKIIDNVYLNETNKGDIFEIDIFNLIRNIFPSAVQLGKRKKGKKVPDGYFDAHIIKGGGIQNEFKGTFLWDAKYTDKADGYDFVISEKRKIVEYINNYNQDSEVVGYSSADRLDCFFIVSNKFKESQFGEISNHVIKNTNGWTGNLVFLELNALLELMKYISSKDYMSKINLFKKFICLDLFEINGIGSHKNYICVTQSRVSEILVKLKDHNKIETSIANKIEG